MLNDYYTNINNFIDFTAQTIDYNSLYDGGTSIKINNSDK